MAMMIGTVATGGERHRPRYVQSIHRRDGAVVAPEADAPLDPMQVSAKTFALLRQALRGVVVEPAGTGGAARSAMAEIAGKTGTAQVVGMPRAGWRPGENPIEDHAWFVAFAPMASPRIAVAVLIEHGGHGGSVAAPIAKKVIEAYLGAGGEPPPAVVATRAAL
jgi:penicillin-binding protein 2